MQTLTPGTLVGRYQIVSILGVGGMGEVYEAIDPLLDRRIALKVLGQQYIRSPEAVERFVQEARAASALNHPNIITVHEIGSADVAVEEGLEPTLRRVHFIAMELIEGQTLRALINMGGLTLRRKIEILAATADGLSKAHKAGIVHRDLKPDNVMVSTDGYAKVLDFGLAKLMERKPASGETATSPSRRITQAGVVLGTVGYMAPEQVEHKAVDHRSDIFSFGCIAYQALTGRGPFDADSVVDTLYAIVHYPPAPVTNFVPAAPPELAALIDRCLEKSPDDRWQSMTDVAGTLHDLALRLNPQAAAVPRRKRIQFLALAALGAAFLTLAIVALVQRREGKQPFTQMNITQIPGTGRTTVAVISPDGRYVGYAVEEQRGQRLNVRQIATGTDLTIVPTAEVHYVGCAFSPDGNYLYYVSADNRSDRGAVYRIPTLGGPATRVIDDLHAAIALSPDGNEIAYPIIDRVRGVSEVIVRRITGEQQRVVATRKLPDSFTAASWSPDGKRVAFALVAYAGGPHTQVGEANLADRRETMLLAPRWRLIETLTWLPDGESLVVAVRESPSASREQLWVLDPRDGQARRITNDLSDYDLATVTADGARIVTLQKTQAANLWVVPDADTTRAARLIPPADTLDGMYGLTRLRGGEVVYASAASDSRDLFVIASTGEPPRRLTDAKSDVYPAASPDGTSVVFVSARSGRSNLWRVDVKTSQVKRLTTGNAESNPAFTSDGKWILFHTNRSGVRTIWRIDPEGGSSEQLTATASSWPSPSPDGKYVACSWFDKESGQAKIALVPSTGGLPEKLLDIPVNSWMGGNNHLVRWRGNALTYVVTTTGVSNIWSRPSDDSAPPAQITRFPEGQIFFFDWSPDGKDLVLSRGSVTSHVVMLESVK